MRKNVLVDGRDIDLLDVMNPAGMFLHGRRQREYSTKDILQLSGKRIPEFNGRRSIRDMFSHKTSLLQPQSAITSSTEEELGASQPHPEVPYLNERPLQINSSVTSDKTSMGTTTCSSLSPAGKKRPFGETLTTKPLKRAKSSSTARTSSTNSKGQRSLNGFFRPKAVPHSDIDIASPDKEKELSQSRPDEITPSRGFLQTAAITESFHKPGMVSTNEKVIPSMCTTPPTLEEKNKKLISSVESLLSNSRRWTSQGQNSVHDPLESKESWSKLFTKPAAPRCDGHNEPCISLLTKKSGMNFGRSFWMCPRPLGPTGAKERSTPWQCQTFIWCSDWNSIAARDSVQEGDLHGST